MIKNNKAILMPETIKIIIAVICIVLLIYLSVSLYGIFISKSEIEQARATLDAIIGKINSLDKDGEKLDYLITGPKAWNIYYFEDVAKISLTTCGGANCLCSCPEFENKEDIPKDSGKCISLGGICRPVKNISFNSICETVLKVGSFFLPKNFVIDLTSNCFNVGKPPLKISIEKDRGIIRFVSVSQSDSDKVNILSLFNFKQNKDSKTIGELIWLFINESKKPENNVEGQSPSPPIMQIISNIKSSINSFIKTSGKDYYRLRIKEKTSGKLLLTLGDNAVEDTSSAIFSSTETYNLKQDNVEYEILFKTGTKT